MQRSRGREEVTITESYAPPPSRLPPVSGERRNRGTSRSRLCLFRARPPVCQVRHGCTPGGRRRYGGGRPKGTIRRRGGGGGVAARAAPLKPQWPGGLGAWALVNLGPAHCALCTVHCVLSPAVQCVPCFVPAGVVHGVVHCRASCAVVYAS